MANAADDPAGEAVVNRSPIVVSLEAQLRAADARLEALDAATRAIAGVLDLENVLQLIADSVRELVNAEYAALGVVNATGRIERFITSGISGEERERIGHPPRGHGLLGLIIRAGRSYRIVDISKHPDSYGFPPNHPPMQSFLGVPVSVAGGSIGNLYLTNKLAAAEFNEADQRLVEMFALHARIAIERARLHAQVQKLAVVEERDRIGKDLHDGIIQAIYGVALSLEDVPDLMEEDSTEATGRVDRAIDRLNLVIRDIRSFILGLDPQLSSDAGLLAGLVALADEVGSNTLIDVARDLAGAHTVVAALPSEAVPQLLQIAREALSNVARHSGASRAVLSLRSEVGAAVLEIVDNGRGFDPKAAPEAGHFGLANLRNRALALGGTLTIESERDAGTRIIVRFPISASEAATT